MDYNVFDFQYKRSGQTFNILKMLEIRWFIHKSLSSDVNSIKTKLKYLDDIMSITFQMSITGMQAWLWIGVAYLYRSTLPFPY